MKRLLLSPPDVGPAERERLLEAFDSGWVAPLGPAVDAFEADLAATTGRRHAVALASGTAAIHLGLVLLGVGPGDEVLVSTLTFAASANPVRYVGATPVFVDSEPASWNLDPDLLDEALRARAARGKLPKAVIAVDLFGQSADYGRIVPICERWGVPLVEDAAEALGATCAGQPAGSFGALGVLSFNGNKIITTGGGGALLTDREDWAVRARKLAQQARDPAPHYQHSELGYNYRLSNLLAAVGRAQLASLGAKVERRRHNFAAYRAGLSGLAGWSFMPEPEWSRSTRWLSVATIDAARFGASREDVRLGLDARGIEARPVWKPMHLQPYYSGCEVVSGAFAERCFRDGLCLPSGSSLSDADLARIVDAVRAQAPVRSEAHP